MASPAVQPTLFDLAPATPDRAPARPFLRSLHAIWAALVASPTLARVANDAHAAVAGRGGNRGDGEAFEAAFWERLGDAEQAAVSAETVARVVEGPGHAFAPLRSVAWSRPGGSRASADFTLTLGFDDDTELPVPVNLKRVRGPQRGDAVAVLPLVAVAMGLGAQGRPGMTVARAALRWWARRERIRPADYLLLLAEGDGSEVTMRAQGLLSTVDGSGRLAASHHPSRDVVQYVPATEPLPDDLDANAEIARVLTPAVTGDDVRLAVLEWLRSQRGWAPSTTATYARALLDMTDEELAAALFDALRARVR